MFQSAALSIIVDYFFNPYSSSPSVLYAHYIVRLYFRSMDRRYYLLFCSPFGCAYCIPPISHILSRVNLSVALLHYYDKAGSPSRREAPKAAIPNTTSALPLQRDELSAGSIPHAYLADIYHLHGPFLVQSHNSHYHGCIYPIIQRSSYR